MLSNIFGERGSGKLARISTVFVVLLSVGLVVFEKTDFRTEKFYPLLSMIIFIIVLIGLTRLKNFHNKGTKMVITAGIIYWALLSAFFIPAVSPLLVINTFLALLSAIFLERYHATVSTLLLILGSEAAFILSNNQIFRDFVFLSIHLISLILIVIFGAWYQIRLSINQQKIASESAQANIERERLQALINSMTDGVLATDTNGRVAVYNGSSLDILNINASLKDKVIGDFLNVIDSDGKRVDVMNIARKQQGYFVSREYLLKQDDTQKINLFISISPVKIGFGHELSNGYIYLLRDITREKSLEEERDEFISVVSHELRTPITIAEGNISNSELVARKANIPDSINTSLEAAHKQIVFLSDMINDLATLSRAERGKLQAAPENIDVHDLVKGLQRDYRANAQQKRISFNTHVDKDVDSIFSSRLYVREILQNFITNAIKYTQEGRVDLTIINKGNRVEFAVHDSGIGISKTDQKHLFKKFFRSEDYRTRENNGTGLGLYVAMKIAKLINAQIGVKSELNEGSTFTLTVPPMKENSVEIA